MSVCMCPDLQYLTVVRISVVAGAVDLSSVPRFSGEASSDHSWTFYTVKDSHLGAAWSSMEQQWRRDRPLAWRPAPPTPRSLEGRDRRRLLEESPAPGLGARCR
jgi:hypothetical protein